MSARTNIITLAAACLLARGAFAQVPAAGSNPVGVWRGTSLCRVRAPVEIMLLALADYEKPDLRDRRPLDCETPTFESMASMRYTRA